MIVDIVKGAGRAPPHPQAWADFTFMMECTPESGHCHSVHSVVFHIRKEIQSLYCSAFYVIIEKKKIYEPNPPCFQIPRAPLVLVGYMYCSQWLANLSSLVITCNPSVNASEPERKHGFTRLSSQPSLLKHLRVAFVILIIVLMYERVVTESSFVFFVS